MNGIEHTSRREDVSARVGLDFLSTDLSDRTRQLNDDPVRREGADYVLCWVQQTLRSHDNPLIDAAIACGNAWNLPVLVYHGVRSDYPYASDRLHDFLLKGSRDLERGCRDRGLACVNYIQTISHKERGLVYRLAERAACVLTDDQPTYVARWQAESFAGNADLGVLAIDTARLVPTQILPDGLSTTPGFRKAHTALRETYGYADQDLVPDILPYDGDLCFESQTLGDMSDDDISALIASCNIDHSLKPCKSFEAGRAVGLRRLDNFISAHLDRYKWTRNNPAETGSGSLLSPYLHFGMIGPRDIFRAVKAAEVHAAAKWKFLDEALTWREWFHYQAFHDSDFDSYDSLPANAKGTLDAHAADPRETVYSLDDLIHGRTDDETWNAAQRVWLATGYLHNNLRMYWGKKLIEWTSSPREAWATACYLNDRISLDGRDPATYGNLQWCFGKSRPASRDQAVYGRVMKKSDTALRKRKGVTEWIDEWATAEIDDVYVPEKLCGYGFPTN